MTTGMNARIAGATFLVYITAGVSGMVIALSAAATVILALVMCFSALLLGVTLFALTRHVDSEIALMGLACRVAEGILGGMFLSATIALRMRSAAGGSDAGGQAVSAFVASARSLNTIVAAIFFAMGSTLFCWLFLRGRVIPVALASLGMFASILLVVALPLQLAGALRGPVVQVIWLPMLAFEVPLGVWLIVRAAALQRTAPPLDALSTPARDAAVRARR
jgi:Domain of unknown function (DUF4386)